MSGVCLLDYNLPPTHTAIMYSDPIADLLTRIRNAQAVGKAEVVLPYSKHKEAIARVLLDNGWVSSVSKLPGTGNVKRRNQKKSEQTFDMLKIGIKYENSRPKIESIRRVSKPGQRIYVTCSNLPYVLSGIGFAIISTSQGVMSSHEARKKGLGGEVVCEVY